jgi:hypothetical protein
MPWSAQKLLSMDALSGLWHCPRQSTDDWGTIMGFFSYFLDGGVHSAIKKGDMEKVKQMLAKIVNANKRKTEQLVKMERAHMERTVMLKERC